MEVRPTPSENKVTYQRRTNDNKGMKQEQGKGERVKTEGNKEGTKEGRKGGRKKGSREMNKNTLEF